ncbi:hypothetical protein PA12_gene4634 [Pseudomonas aeruginosa]|nr:hypothetical protein PA12_gene4634 [Pseudomonas aeruginosa]
MFHFQPSCGSFPESKIHARIPDPSTKLDDRKYDVDMQVSLIAMHDIHRLPISRSDFNHRLFSQLNRLLSCQLISLVLGISGEKTQHGMYKIILRWLFSAALPSSEFPQRSSPLFRKAERCLAGQHRQRVDRLMPQHALI